MTREEAKIIMEHCRNFYNYSDIGEQIVLAFNMSIEALAQEPCEDAVSRKAVIETLDDMDNVLDEDRTVENYKELLKECYEVLPSVNSQKPQKGYISIDDVMSVFDDFMCGDVDEDGTEIFLEMLKDKAESEVSK